jgi:hypothetical protein
MGTRMVKIFEATDSVEFALTDVHTESALAN